jgi:hypothetical protein
MALRKVVPIIAAGAVAGILGVGGASLALAQEEPSTTTPSTGEDQTPSTTPDDGQPDRGDGNCPEKDGQDGGSSTEGSSV